MAIPLTLPGVKADRRRPVPSYAPPVAPPQVPSPARQAVPVAQAEPQGPVSSGLDPAIVARLASKADQVGFNNADVGKLLKMLPEVIALLTAPMELVKTGNPERPYRRELVRPQATDMTGQTDIG